MKKALVACLPDPSGNPRPNRVIHLLANSQYLVDTLSLPPALPFEAIRKTYATKSSPVTALGIRWRKLLFYAIYLGGILRMPTKYFELIFSSIYGTGVYKKSLLKEAYDLIIVEDLNLLPFVFALKTEKTRIIFDAREYYPKENDELAVFRRYIAPYRIHFCRIYLHRLDGFYTVSEGLAKLYFSEFGVLPKVIRSTPLYRSEPPLKSLVLPIRMVHHGIASPNRQLENMIDIIKQLNGKYTLDFYLTGDAAYKDFLVEHAANCPYIKFNAAVKFAELHDVLSQYDMGFCYMSVDVTNTMYSLPNKFFEYVQARVVLVINPAPDMYQLAKEYNMALVASDFSNEAMLNALSHFQPEQYELLHEGVRAAAKVLCWEEESKKLLALIEEAQHIH